MKIPESIIEKYQLVSSGDQCGYSFMNNLLIYKSNAPGFEKVKFMECDLSGEPVKDIALLVDNVYGGIIPELLENAPVENILSIIKEIIR